MLVLLALHESKLNLNDSLATFFPALKEIAWRKITIEQLLSHRSGIPHNEGIPDYWTLTSLLPLTRQRALAQIFNMKLLFPPGTDVKYSSPGYFLLASILEDIYHKDYAAILKEKITGPLGMRYTGIFNTKAIIPGITSSYHLLGDSLIVAPYRDFSLMKGSGDMFSNAEDLSKWTNSFGSNVWDDTIKEQVFSPHTDKGLHGNDDRYGFGWFIRPASKSFTSAYYVGGGTYGCSALAVWYPVEKISITILSNVSVLPVNEIWADIEKIVFNKPFQLPHLNSNLHIDADQLKKFAGQYNSDIQGMDLWIALDKGQLYAKLGNNPPFEIYPGSPLEFYGKKINITFTYGKKINITFTFQADEEGVITGLVANGRAQVITFNKKQP
jgi:CubicO group peptidase (beta-lactamase class C family)